MKIELQIEYWIKSAEHDLEVSKSLFNTAHYDYCLYLGHLVLEKTLKALYVKANLKNPPRTHDLLYLADTSNIPLSIDQKESFFMINRFNIEARYPDEKFQFYEMCNKDFTEENLQKIMEIHKWLISLLA
jgi:HEPN domain-containing protein